MTMLIGKKRIAIFGLAVAAALAFAPRAAATPEAVASSKATYYLSLGDSLATGAQPAGSGVFNGLRAANGTNRGYADVLHDLMRAELGNLQLRNFGCGGETTASLIAGGNPTCGPSGLPLNVQRACQWTWICDVGDIHANDAGYAVIAQAFVGRVLSP